jgi:uroporphyrinogen III methyltransferase/synthase
VRNFALLVGAERLRAMQASGRPLVACLGPVTAETARELGLATAVQPATYTTDALVTALVDHFCKAGTDPVAS